VEALAARDTAAAIQAGERMLVVERQLFGNVHAETASGLNFLSRLYYMGNDAFSHGKARAEIVEITKALLGEKHWRIRELDYFRYRDAVLLKLPKEDRQLPHEVVAVRTKAEQLHRAQKYHEGLEVARQAKAMTEALFKKVEQAGWKLPATETYEYALALRAEAFNLEGLNQLEAAEKNWTTASTIAKSLFGPNSLEYAEMQDLLGRVQMPRENWEHAERAFRTALDVYEVEDGGKGERLGALLFRVGYVYRRRHENSRAEAVCRRAVELLAAAGLKEKTIYAAALAEHGRALISTGKTAEGRALLQESLAVTAKATSGQGSRYAQSLNDVADLMAHSTETAAEALKLIDDAAAVCRSAGLEKDRLFGLLLETRAKAQQTAGAFPEAEASRRESSLVLGRTRSTADGFANLYHAWIRSALKSERFDEALDITRRLEKVIAEVYGPTHEATVTARLDAIAYEKAVRLSPEQRKKDSTLQLLEEGRAQLTGGKYDAALATLTRGAQLREELYGADDVYLADFVLYLGEVNYLLSRRTESERHYRRFTELMSRIYPPESSPTSVGNILSRQADMLVERGEPSRAIPLYQEARRICRARGGKTSVDYLLATDRTAFALIEIGEFDRADTLLKESLAGHARTSGDKSVHYGQSLRWIGRMQIRSGDGAGMTLVLQAEKILRDQAEAAGRVSFDHVAVVVEMGEYFADMGDHRAVPTLEWANDILRKELPWRRSFHGVRCLRCLGIAYLKTGKLDKAEQSTREAIELLRTQARGLPGYRYELDLLSRVLIQKGVKAYLAGKFDDYVAALRSVLEAWTLYAGADHPITRVKRSDAAAAEKVGKLDAPSRKRRDDALRAKMRAESIAAQKDKADEAVAMADQFVATMRELLGQDTYAYINAIQTKATVLSRAGKGREAVAAWNDVLSSATSQFGADCDIAGVAHYELSLLAVDRAEALRLVGRAADVLERSLGKRSAVYGVVLERRGAVEFESGDLRKAEATLREALEVLSPLQREAPGPYLSCLGWYTNTALALRDFERAGELARRQSLVASRRFGKGSAAYANACITLASFHSNLREHEKAEPLLREAATIRQKVFGTTSIEYAHALARLAEACRERGDALLAEPLFRQALGAYEKRFGPESVQASTIWLELGRLNLARGEVGEAHDNLRKAGDLRLKLRGAHSVEYGSCLALLGDVAMQRGEVKGAVEFYREILTRREQSAERMAPLQTEEQQLLTATALRESLDQFLSLGDAIPAEDVYAHVLAWKGTVLDRQRRLRALRSDPKKANAFQTWERLTAELVALALRPPYAEDRALWADRIRELAADRAAAERDLVGGEFQRSAPAKPADVAKALAPESVLVDLLEYVHRTPQKLMPGQWHVERRLAAFIVRRGEGVKRVDLGPADAATKLVDAWMKVNDPVQEGSKGKPASDAKAELALHGRRLRTLVWDPLDPYMKNANLVLVSPDGALARFPFPALPGRAAGSFLIEEVALSIVPVPSQLATPRTNSASGGLLAIGDVDFGGPLGAPAASRASSDARAIGNFFWTRLPASGPDAENVRRFFLKSFPGQSATVLKGGDATEAAFRVHAPKSRWLHLSTHGFYVADMGDKITAGVPKTRVPGETANESRVVSLPAGLLSGIALAGANTPNASDQDDGLLFALEAGALDLSSVELAVLSACDTAVGRLATGEGVLGLQRTFHAAGAQGVIAALWPASDAGSMLLMGRFYINLWEKKLSKPEALREAQRWMIDAARKGAKEKVPEEWGPRSDVLPERFAAPDIWAAFILSGDSR
jgi:CHAT domain-containing protein/tetratricopeptide (TPR) repeat protein